MGSTYGKKLKITIYGESHGKAIGMVAEGFPAGEIIDMDQLLAFMARRSAVGKKYSTPRKEPDIPVFLSGVLEQPAELPGADADGGGQKYKILNSPVCVMIENTNQKSGDYNNLKDVPRPGHADFAAMMRYGSGVDLRGGGHFSGRLTAPLCAAGGMAKQILERRGITVTAQMIAVGGVSGAAAMDPVTGIHRVDEAGLQAMMEAMAQAQAEGDSVGGIIECVVEGLPAGSCGDHMFDGMEGRISQAVFGIPAVKGIEFGNGFACAALRGSQNNDPFFVDEDGTVRTKSNNHGGILGGIASGMPVVFRVAVKPTPSIFKEQDSVSMSGGCDTKLKIKGRHDPCIVQRAVPVVEAAAALAVLDGLLDSTPAGK
ncbi:MAG: chorismate synthase [Firmicutes bacterium]|nr:chorismate synthase [Bacillota bacterium]